MKKTTLVIPVLILAGIATYQRAGAQNAPTTRPSFNNYSNDQQNNGFNNNRRRNRGNGNDRNGYSRPAQVTEDYSVLDRRSIFFKGHFEPPIGGPPRDVPPVALEQITFNGITVSRFDKSVAVGAYLENTGTGSVQFAKIGDPVAGGRITGIDMANNTLDFEVSGRVKHLNIGQNLAGEQIYGVNSSPSSTTAPTIDLSGPNADVLKKLMERRQQELNGGK
jgi:hypothetical protein